MVKERPVPLRATVRVLPASLALVCVALLVVVVAVLLFHDGRPSAAQASGVSGGSEVLAPAVSWWPPRTTRRVTLESFAAVRRAPVDGKTRLQRRLSIGEKLRELLRRFEARWAAVTGGRFDGECFEAGELDPDLVMPLYSELVPLERELRGLLHHVDSFDDVAYRGFRFLGCDEDASQTLEFRVFRLGAALQIVAGQTLDPESLALAVPSPSGDPLGRDLPIRYWTRRDRVEEDMPSPGEVRAAEDLIRRLVEVTGAKIEHGFDTLLTPAAGREMIQPRVVSSPAAGRYYGGSLCAVESTLHPRDRRLTLKHELVHAFCDQFTYGLACTPFLNEGLAEYLKRLERWDDGLEVPPGKFDREFTELLQADGGGSGATLEPKTLLWLTGRDFYDLGRTGYLIAQATMAFIGPEVIERAFRRRCPGALIHAIEAVDGDTLMAFVFAQAYPYSSYSREPGEAW